MHLPVKGALASGVSISAPAQPRAPLCPRANREGKATPCTAGLTGGTWAPQEDSLGGDAEASPAWPGARFFCCRLWLSASPRDWNSCGGQGTPRLSPPRRPSPCTLGACVYFARSLPLPAFPQHLASSAPRPAVLRLQAAPAAPNSRLGGARGIVTSAASAGPQLLSGCLESSG